MVEFEHQIPANEFEQCCWRDHFQEVSTELHQEYPHLCLDHL